jgi:geranylgeranyl pyrophosphate synthase
MIDPKTFDNLLKEYKQRVDQAMDRWLPPENLNPSVLHQAMRYSVLGSGKRVRPALVYATATALDIPLQRVDGIAAAIELIHAYSLIHDDLPAMDDDDLRRGRPTCHKQFDEATAILAGDALQALSFYILSHDPDMTNNSARRLRMIETLSLYSGSRGMAGGQAIDLASVGQRLDLAELETMHIHKTGALIRTCIQLAALSADHVDDDAFHALDSYAKKIGLSFQIQDDILDVIGDTETLGKPQGSDAEQDKPTFPSIIGLEAAREKADDLHQRAIEAIKDFPASADVLRHISYWFVHREH